SGGIAPHRSHALDGADAEQVKAALNDTTRQIAEQQTTLPPLRRRRLKDWAVDVEAARGLRQIPQIRRYEVRLVLLRRAVEDLLESQQLDRQRPLLRHLQQWAGGIGAERGRVYFPPAKDTAVADVGVLNVRRRVAIHRQHLVPVEDIIARPILGQVGVLYRSQTDNFGDLLFLLFAQRRHFLPALQALRPCPLILFTLPHDRLVEQGSQLHDPAGPRPEHYHSAVRQSLQDRAELDVLQLDLVIAPASGDAEQPAEVQILRRAHDVE